MINNQSDCKFTTICFQATDCMKTVTVSQRVKENYAMNRTSNLMIECNVWKFFLFNLITVVHLLCLYMKLKKFIQ